MNHSELQIEFEKIINRDYFSDNLNSIRTKAFKDFTSLGLPSKKWEDWRFTNLSSFDKNSYVISDKSHNTPNDIDLKQFRIPETDTIVFINGHYSTTLSDKINGVQLLTGIEYFEYKNSENNLISKCPFELLNTAFMDSGMNIIIKKNQILNRPIRFLFIYFIFRKYNDFP